MSDSAPEVTLELSSEEPKSGGESREESVAQAVAAATPGPADLCTLYVNSLDYAVTKDQVHERFSAFGKVLVCVIPKNPDGRARGYGFVQLSNRAEAQAALDGLNGKEWNGRLICVEFSKRGQGRPLRESPPPRRQYDRDDRRDRQYDRDDRRDRQDYGDRDRRHVRHGRRDDRDERDDRRSRRRSSRDDYSPPRRHSRRRNSDSN